MTPPTNAATVPSKSRLAGVEAGRGIAATLVVLYHAARHIQKVSGSTVTSGLFQFGHAGVDFFFVISGFIILFAHYRDVGRADRLGHYLNRRATRILPAYWVALLLVILIDRAVGHSFPPASAIAWSSLLLPSNEEPILGIAWTLQYEVVFYAVFAALIINRALGLTLLALWAVWVVATAIGLGGAGGLPLSLCGAYNLEFFLGMITAYCLKTRVIPAPCVVLGAGVGLFALSALAENTHLIDGYADYARLAYGIPSAIIILGVVEAGRQNRLAIPKILGTLGSATYSIYLFQFIFIGAIWKLIQLTGFDRLPPTAWFPVIAGGTVLGGVGAWWFIERPLMNFIRQDRPKRVEVSVSG